jgi:enoyl-CoA hydratase/long-chain 3-hydroxyacyl-CoA dehydrogenase
MLGLLPGAGGTQRLPRTVGLQEGLTMCMTGKNVAAEKAKKIGLVDMVVDPYALENAAIRAVKDIAAGRVSRSKPKQKPLFTRLLEDTEVGQNLVFDQAKKTVMKQTGGHYPAPLAILECVRAGVQKGAKAGFAKESEEFGKLGGTAVSSSLISIFNGQTACKKNNFGKPEAPIRTVACVGAGLMGSGIAAVTVQKGYTTILKDVTEAAVARGEANVYSIMDKKVKKKQLSAFNRDATLSQLVPLTDKDQHWKAHFAKADMVIEAVFESLELKHKVMAELEAVIPAHCVFATNTSALPITQIAKASKRPDKVVGMHYFSPVEKMPLLEVVTHEGTSRSTVAAAVDVGLKQGKTVIVVKDGPGFYTTRILSPFMSEGAALLNEGVSISRLDAALKKFGFPVGPVTLLDEVGIDVGYHISKDLIKALGDRMGGADPAVFGDMVKAGLLGRKSGKGFFLYDQAKPSAAGKALSAVQGALASLGVPGVKKPSSGKPINPEAEAILARYSRAPRDKEGKLLPSAVTDADICNRLVLRMVNEAVLCLQEGVLANPVDGDIGAVFGLGFPPFLGGPFRYIDAVGSAAIVKAMEDLGERLGDKVRFAPAPLLLQHAKNNTKFHAAK